MFPDSSSNPPLLIDYKFVQPLASTNLRSIQPLKFVRREYLIMTSMSIIGYIGGILGMFLGFSFSGAFEGFQVFMAKSLHNFVRLRSFKTTFVENIMRMTWSVFTISDIENIGTKKFWLFLNCVRGILKPKHVWDSYSHLFDPSFRGNL